MFSLGLFSRARSLAYATLLAPVAAFAGVVAEWNFEAPIAVGAVFPHAPSDTAPGVSVSNLSQQGLSGTGVQVVATSVNGDALPSQMQQLSFFTVVNGTTAAPTQPTDDYIAFTVTPSAPVNLTKLRMDLAIAQNVAETGKVLRAFLFVDTDGDGTYQQVGTLKSATNGTSSVPASTSSPVTVQWVLGDANFPATISSATQFRITFNDNSSRSTAGSPAAAAYIDNIVLEDDKKDPNLLVSAASPQADFNFGTTLGLPVVQSRTVRLENPAASLNSLTVESITLTEDANEAFALISGTTATPVTLNPGDTIDLVVSFATTVAGAYNGTARIATNVPALDLDLPLFAGVAEAGRELLQNGIFEANPFLSGWLPRDGLFSVSGLAAGSQKAIRVRGAGDPTGSTGTDLTQALEIPMSDFVTQLYVATPSVPGASPLDRNLQFWMEGGSTGSPILINIAHLPAGNGTSEGGFHAFNGSSWVRIPGLPALLGSTDGDGDGDLGGIGDTRNVYFIRLVGKNIGTSGATYDVQVSQPNSRTIAASATGLTTFASPLATAGTQAVNLRFVTSDVLAPGGNAKHRFWVDDVSVAAGSVAAEPKLSVVSDLDFAPSFGSTGAVTRPLVLRNDGATSLTVTGISSNDARFSLVSAPSLPLLLAAGQTSTMTLRFDAAGQFGLAVGELSFASNDSLSPTKVAVATAGLLDPSEPLVTNGDFESGLAGWSPLSAVTVSGLVGASTLAADIPVGARAAQVMPVPAPGDFYLDFLFQSPGGGTNQRWINFAIRANAADDGGSEIVNLRYSGTVSTWTAFSGTPAGGTNAWQNLSPSLPQLMANTPYILRFIGRGWGSPGAVYDLQVYSVDGNLLGEQSGIVVYHNFSANQAQARSVSFTQEFGGSGFKIDNVQLFAGRPTTISPDSIEGLGFVPLGGGAYTLRFTSLPAKTYSLQVSDNLLQWNNLATGLAPEGTSTKRSFTDPQAGTAPRRFYRINQE